MKHIYQKIGNQGLVALLLVFGATALQSQSFTIGTLPAGKTIVATYEVMVNASASACPTGTVPGGDISNQSNVTGNFGMVSTYETTPLTPDPTLTPFGGLTLGNLAYKDVNKDGDYDNGTDSPIDGVMLRLYLDDGDGVLDAGDGSHIATATTSGGGLYSFAVCPGDYIVEVIPSNFNSGGPLYDNGLGTALVSSPLTAASDPDFDTDDNDDNGDPISGFGVASKAITMAYGTEPDGADLNTNNRLDFGFKTPTTVTISDVMMAEGTGSGPALFNFTVTRSDTDAAFSLTVNTAGGTATSGTDFTAISNGTVSFLAGGSPTATVTVNVTHDNIVEPNETFTVTLSAPPAGVVITDATGDGTINNDDSATITLSNGVANNEGTSGPPGFSNNNYTATLSAPVQGGFKLIFAVSDGNAMAADNDYNVITTSPIDFLGNANEVGTIVIQIPFDNKVELDEVFQVHLPAIFNTTAPAGSITIANSPQTATITNDDAASVGIAASIMQAENITPQTFTVTLNNPVDVNVVVHMGSTSGTATIADLDYASLTGTSVTFLANTTTAQTANVTIINDNKVEADEIYGVNVQSINSSGRNVAYNNVGRSGTILNDDAATVTLTGGIAQNEGNSGTTAYTFTATLNNPVQGGFTAAYTTTDGTATTADNDYAANDGPALSFDGTAAETKTVTVQVNGDLNIEANETFTVLLGTITAATPVQTAAISIGGTNPQTGTITNDEKDWGDAPTNAQSGFAGTYPTLSANSGANHAAALSGLRLGATIDGDADGQPNATATGDGADEDGVTLPASFITGLNSNIMVSVNAVCKLDAWADWNRDGDWNDAGEQIFTTQGLTAGINALSVAVPGGASVGTSYVRFRVSNAGGLAPTGAAAEGEVEDYQVSILSNAYSITSPTVTEGDAGMVNLTYTISRTDNTNAGSVNYSAPTGTATSGTDYQAFAGGTASFMAGGAFSQNITVVVNGDMVVEDNETVVIALSNPVGGGIGTGTGTGTITNNDLATLTLLGIPSQSEGSTFNFSATLDKAVQGGFKVAYTTGGGSATSGTDYTDNDGTLTFSGNVGEVLSWNLTTSNDATVELDENFEGALGAITMTSAVQAAAITMADSPQNSIIANNDQALVSIHADVSQSEAITPQTFTLKITNPVEVPVTVKFSTVNGTASAADNDFSAITNQTVTFPANTTTDQTVSVTIVDDNKVEADETFTASIDMLAASGRNVIFGTTSRTGTIQNDDAATVTLTPNGGVTLNEGNSGTTNFVFTATLNNPVQDGFTLAYTTSDGTATTADNDYVDNDGPALAFAGTANEAQTITVQVNGDNKVEGNDNFIVALGAFGGSSLTASLSTSGSPKTGTILNDEVDWGDAPDPAYATLSANNGARHKTLFGFQLGATIDGDADGQPTANADGDGADEDGVTLPSALVLNTTANITVNASAIGLLNAWVDWNGNGTWESPSEQVFTNTSLSAGDNLLTIAVPAGATLGTSYARFRFGSDIGLTPTGDADYGEVEDYKIEIVNTQFSIDDPMVTEGDAPGTSNLTFTISRSTDANACSVQYGITGGTATSGSDYQAFAGGTASFAANNGVFTQLVTVVVNRDNTVELNETVLMTLSNPINASILDGSGTGTITNDDQSIITIDNPSIVEGDGGTSNLFFNFYLSKRSDANISIDYLAVSNTAIAGSDFLNSAGNVNIAPGNMSGVFIVKINGDCEIEPNETFFGRLSNLNANGRNIIFSGGGSTLDGTVTIANDDALPVITCGSNLSQNAAAGVCNATVTLPLPTTSSLCGSSTLEFHYCTVDAANMPTGPFSAYAPAANNTVNFAVGRHEIEWRVTDGSGSSTCNLYLDVIDNQNPSIVCPSNISKNTDPNLCTAVVTYSLPTASDNCSGVVVMRTSGANTASGSAFPAGIPTMVNWKATDASGNMSVCQFTVTVVDVQLPNITCPSNIVRNTDAGLCTAVVTYATPTASDNCSVASVLRTAGPASGSAFAKGPTTVTYEASDAATPPNKKSCSFTVTVNDNQLPTITCPANQTKGTDLNACTAVTTYADPVMADNCPGGSVSLVSGLASGQPFPKGITTVQWKATDAAGLTKTCTFRVTVNDTQAPTISCPSSQSLNTDANLCSAVANYAAPTGADNCAPPPTVAKTSGLASGSAFPRGASAVVWRATDGAGLTKTCSFTITVTDAQLPTISCPPNISATAAPGQCNTTVSYTSPTATDNCTVQSTFLLSGLGSGSLFPQGVTTVVWRTIDNSGGSSTCAFTVTVSCGTGSQELEVRTASAEATAGKSSKFEVSTTSNFKLQTLNFELSPNPASSEVRFMVSGLEGKEGELVVFDALGRAVLRQAISPGQIEGSFDSSAWAEGFYQVVLRTEKERIAKGLMVVKE